MEEFIDTLLNIRSSIDANFMPTVVADQPHVERQPRAETGRKESGKIPQRFAAR